ncbi:PEP-CTERM system histidine kinase PrsK [bacterium]|nr:PEP-CTERM system histidine kinase PrsK [bacterium]
MRRNPKALLSRAFGLGVLCIAVIEFGHFMSLVVSGGDRVLFWFKFALAGTCFLPVTWSLFSFLLLQPDPKAIIQKRLGYFLLLLIAGIGFLALIPSNRLIYILPEARSLWLGAMRFGMLGRWFLIYLLLSVVIMLVFLENTYRNTHQRGGRYALYGLIGSLFYAIFLFSQGLLYSRIPSAVFLVGSAVIFAAGLFFAYDIVRYQLLQVDIYVGRGAVYSSVILLLVGAYLILMGLVGKLVRVMGGNLNLLFTILAALVMFFLLLALLVSGSLKKRLKSFIDRNFYRGRYDYREQWLRFSEEMSSLLSLQELLPRFLHMVMETLDVHKAGILLPGGSQGDFLQAEAEDLPDEELCIPEKSEFLDWLFVLGKPVLLEDSRFNENIAQQVLFQRNRLQNLGLVALVPLITKRKLVGLLVLGSAASGDSFSSVDMELLETIGNHLSMAILNAKLSEELVLSKELEFIHKISSFVVHDLKNLISTLSMMLQNAADNMDKPEFRENMLVTISGTVEKIKGLMNKITTMPTDFQLDFQPQGLNSIIKEIVSKIKIDQMAHIQYVEDLRPLPDTSVDREYVERILMNLVVNALEAMHQEGTLRISTRFVEDGTELPADEKSAGRASKLVEIEVADSGAGMSKEFIKHKLFKPFQTTKEKGLGIGLYQCKEAVEAHGGSIEVKSREGEGTVFMVRLPIVHSIIDL